MHISAEAEVCEWAYAGQLTAESKHRIFVRFYAKNQMHAALPSSELFGPQPVLTKLGV